MRVWVLFFGWFAAGFGYVPSAGAAEAVDRGRLSLAWDAHDSGRCDEALAYLAEIPVDSPLGERATWLRAECWFDLGEHARAAAALLAPEAAEVEGREEFLRDIYWEQAWLAASREAHGEALEVLTAALRLFPNDLELAALGEAVLHRQQLAADLAAERATPSVQLLSQEETPAGAGWVLAYPWRGEGQWVPRSTAEEWWPSVAGQVRDAGQTLWLRVAVGPLGVEMERVAASVGLRVRQEAWGWSVGLDQEWFAVDRDEWQFRAAAEGLGVRGAARFAVAEAAALLAGQKALVNWVEQHKGALLVTRVPEGLRLSHPQSGRGFVLASLEWAELFQGEPDAWQSFWREMITELARPARPYRCFCGRPVVLREALSGAADGLLVVGHEGDVLVVVAALCPDHLRYVSPELAREWGVSPAQLAARAAEDGRANPWELGFGRGEVEGASFLFLEGEGVSSLVRAPELLLGALERADGYGLRGAAVRIYAATGSTLVVARTEAPERIPRLAAERLLLAQARHGVLAAGTRLEYRATLRLPEQPQGTFSLTPVE